MASSQTYSQCSAFAHALLQRNVNSVFASSHTNWTSEVPGFTAANFRYDNYQHFAFEDNNFTAVCAAAGSVFPDESGGQGVRGANDTTAVVFNVTMFDAPKAMNETTTRTSATTVLRIGSCDGNVTYNITSTGVYVVPGTYAFGVIERKTSDDGQSCEVGRARIKYTAAPLVDYCREYTTFPECKSNATISDQSSGRLPTLPYAWGLACALLTATIV